jgi:hypothetical protein
MDVGVLPMRSSRERGKGERGAEAPVIFRGEGGERGIGQKKEK